MLRLDRLRALVDVYPGRGPRGRDGRRLRLLPPRPGRRGTVDRHGHARPGRRRPRRPPPPRQRHRHRHRGRRRAADQGHLRRQGRLGAVAPARLPARPRHRRGPARPTRRPSACILGGHGITAWGATSDEAEANSPLDHRARPRPTSTPTATRARSAPSSTIAARSPRPSGGRRRRRWRRTCAPSPRATSAMVGHFTDSDVVLDFLAGEKLLALAELGTSCPDHFLRTKVKPLVLDLPADASVDDVRRAASASSTSAYRADYRGLLRAPRHPGLAADAGRRPGHHPRPRRRHVLLRQGQADGPRRRRVLRQRHQRHARRRGGLDLRPDPREREVPHRVLGARGGQAAAPARSRSATPGASRSSPAPPAASARPSPPSSRPRAPASSSPTSTATARGDGRGRARRRPTSRSGSPPTSPTPTPSAPPSTPRSSPSAASTSSSTTPACRSPSRCSRRPSRTGTSSTTSWPRAASSSRRPRPGR